MEPNNLDRQRSPGKGEPDSTMAVRRVLLVIHNPTIPFEGGKKLSRVFGWNDPDRLTAQFVEDLNVCSHGRARFQVTQRVEIDSFPIKADGFVYTPKSYLTAWRAKSGFHMPDDIDYHRLLTEFDVLEGVRADRIDEVWLFGFPYAGCYESIMGGPGAFWCNAPPLAGTEVAGRRFVIMAYNYERGVGEMLESFGHRAESILSQVYQDQKGDPSLWERFTRYDLTHPGMAEVGTVHFAPNSERDYDWGNRRFVPSRCDDWLHLPGSRSEPRLVNCEEWGNGDTRLHHLWWFKHFPHDEGETDGVSHNWWNYILDPQLVATYKS